MFTFSTHEAITFAATTNTTTKMAEALAAPSITNVQEYDLVLNPKDDLQQPGLIDGAPIVELISGEVTFRQDPATPLIVTVVSTSTTGNYEFNVNADPNLDPEVTGSLVLNVQGTVTAAEVSGLGATFGEPRTRTA